MTRFWLTLDQGVRFVISAIEQMHGGEVFIPRIPSMNIMDLVAAIAPGCAVENIGIRPGEKLHEALIGEDEARHSLEFADRFIIEPLHHWWGNGKHPGGKRLPEGFRYSSETNTEWLNVEQLKTLADE